MISNPSYYRKSLITKLAIDLSIKVRLEIVNEFIRLFPSKLKPKILDLGVTSEIDPTANFLEQIYPDLTCITCAGVQENLHIEKAYPGVKFLKIESGKPLPFKNKEFDVVYSNAVIEHVGDSDKQAEFIREILRVSKHFYITTPNKWFPIEMHTHLPFIHFLPRKYFSAILRIMGEEFYSDINNLNLLDLSSLKKLFPKDIILKYRFVSTLNFPSNIIIYGEALE
jgi:SAM-dependent methyltransferase